MIARRFHSGCKRVVILAVLAASALAAQEDPSVSTVDSRAEALRRLQQDQEIHRGYLGLDVDYLVPAADGLGQFRVGQIYPQSPAAAAGVRVGDLITAVNGVTFSFPSRDLAFKAWAWVRTGDPVELTLLREGKPLRLGLTAAEMPAWILTGWQRAVRRAEADLGLALLIRQLGRSAAGTLRFILTRDQNGQIAARFSGTGSDDLNADDLKYVARFFEDHPAHGHNLDDLLPGAQRTCEISVGADHHLSVTFVR